MAGTHFDNGVQQTGGADYLLHNDAFGLHQFVVGRGGADVYHLLCHRLKFLELQRAVVHCGGKPETVFHQVCLPGTVAAVHGAYLRNADVTFVNDDKKIIGKEIQQTVGPRTRRTPVEIARIVFYARAVTQFAQHLHVVGNTLLQTLGLERTAFALEPLHLLVQVVLYLVDGAQGGFFGSHEEVGGVYLVSIETGDCNTAHGVYLFDTVHLVFPENDAQKVVGVCKVDVYGIALYTEVAAVQVDVVADVEAVYKTAQEYVAAVGFSLLHFDYVVIEIRRISHTVNARYGRYHHHVLASGKQGGSGGKPQLVYFVVDGEVLFYIGVRRGQVGFGLVIVVIGYVIFHCVIREESLELAVELCRQRLVMAQYERRLVDVGYDVGNGECLSGAGHAQQGLCGNSLKHSFGELCDCFRLVAGGAVGGC